MKYVTSLASETHVRSPKTLVTKSLVSKWFVAKPLWFWNQSGQIFWFWLIENLEILLILEVLRNGTFLVLKMETVVFGSRELKLSTILLTRVNIHVFSSKLRYKTQKPRNSFPQPNRCFPSFEAFLWKFENFYISTILNFLKIWSYSVPKSTSWATSLVINEFLWGKCKNHRKKDVFLLWSVE